MIKRYTTKEMDKLWSDQNKYQTWLKVEIAVLEVFCEMEIIPLKTLKNIKTKANFTVDRINEIEKVTRHDVIAFLTNIAEYVGKDSRYVHMGMTSSDLLDTSLGLLCKEAGGVLLNKLTNFHEVLVKKALKYKYTYQIGRSHGVHAEPITFGLKLALWSEEIKRHIIRWKTAIDTISTGKISGAVGTYQHINPKIEKRVCQKLGLAIESVSNQVVQRDRHAHFLSTLAIIGSTIEKIAIEIRHLQRTEVLEVEEYFLKGQKGSSAMPHKKNPIVTERMTGLARLLRSNAHVSMENVALWHERDISHSSVERIIIPDSTTLMDYMLDKMTFLIDNMTVYPDNMLKNLNLTNGLIFSQEVLLGLINKGLTREESYKIVQQNAMKTWKEKKDFIDVLLSDEKVSKVFNKKDLQKLFDLKKIGKNVDYIFNRLGVKK